ncbi:hypothetical protein MCUN1_002939 [Malassezia cuniculi]|uniref:Peptidase M50B-like-domain-containing protein n=1 Tax=Malassezia cuniculi TaxID=948313 RepID=A0AAF0F0M4_9BASI|nr:hypothetical protein MCUN1_002939 [Malassezia cuniculi]
MPPAYIYVRAEKDSPLDVTPDQRNTIIVACVYAVAIMILWVVPYLNMVLYPFKLLTVGFHEFSHALAGVLTCAKIESIELDPDEGGATRMRGGISLLTLPAGYLGSSLIGAILIACGFDERASKVASIVVGVFFVMMLWWARRNLLTWVLIICMAGLFVLFWFVADSVALRYFVLFIGVMNCLYSVWDIFDDLVLRKVNESDASAFARVVGCCPAQVWGFIWLLISIAFFVGGILVGIVVFTTPVSEQQASNFLDVPT